MRLAGLSKWRSARHTFNSLFEMPYLERPPDDEISFAAFNSLFEMLVAMVVVCAPDMTSAFNSLFEMRLEYPRCIQIRAP